MKREAKVVDGVPQSGGWFVVNARDARWWHNELGAYCAFAPREYMSELGVTLNVLPPGAPMAMYHEEEDVEAFLVLRGSCTLIVEGEERPLRRWDFFYCPPWTKHVIVGRSDEAALVLGTSTRGKRGINYPVDAVARRYGAGVDDATSDGRQAYARYSEPEPGPAPEL